MRVTHRSAKNTSTAAQSEDARPCELTHTVYQTVYDNYCKACVWRFKASTVYMMAKLIMTPWFN